MMPGDEFLRDG